MNEMKAFKIRNLGVYGVIRPAEVDHTLIPEGAVAEAVNVNFDRRGAITLRPGITAVGATVSAGYPCLGIHNAQSSTMLAVFSDGTNNDIYRYNGSAWAKSLEDDTKDSKTRFVDFAGRTIRVNGVNASMMAWAGSTTAWEHYGNPINPQQVNDNSVKPQFCEVYKSRVYLAGDGTYSDRLYYSSVISSAGNVTWDITNDWVDINPDDGENITALKRYSLELLVFKPNYIYRFKTSSVDPDPLIKLGTRSQESIVEGKKGVYFHHNSGFYVYSGSYPQEISRPISDIVDSIAYANYDDICAWKDNDHIYWSVGDCTIEGVTWKHVVCRYTESSEVWTVYSYANCPKFACERNTGSAINSVIGTDNGLVATVNSGNTDMGEPIKYRIITKKYEMGDISADKVINKIVSVCEKQQAGQLMYRIDDKDEWHTIGTSKNFISEFDDLKIDFNSISFKLTGVSNNEAFVWLGLEIKKWSTKYGDTNKD